MLQPLRLHDAFTARLARIGREQQPVLVIDNFVSDPEALVDFAARLPFYPPASGYYPGVRARAGQAYVAAVMTHLSPIIRELFAAQPMDAEFIESNFSLVTTPGERLVRLQRMPHYDSPSPYHIAILHYLCRPEHGGTAFFRHGASGVEMVTPAGAVNYHAMAERDVIEHGEPPSGYLQGGSAAYEQIAAFEAVFNRVLIYRGANLHSGLIPREDLLCADPSRGRLTVNTFVRLTPPAQPWSVLAARGSSTPAT